MTTESPPVPRPRVVLHIGTHKTGSTSLQYFLDRERDKLWDCGIAYFQGRHIRDNHVELHAAAMRPDRPSPFKLDTGLVVDADYVASVRRALRDFVDAAGDRLCVFSAEGMSYLRYMDEVSTLKSFFPDADIDILVYLRERESYRRSHQSQFDRRVAAGRLIDPSFADLGPGSWLLDYEARLRPFKTVFGEAHVHVVDFDAARVSDGSVIPSCLRFLGVDHHFAPVDWRSIALNTATA